VSAPPVAGVAGAGRSTPPTIVVVHDADVLAELAAARLLTRLVDAQALRGRAHLVLTGGGVGIATLEAVRRSSARHAVDWRRVDVWWGDERFVPADDPERNERQAREALLDHLDLDPARVHPMGALGGPDGDDADAAAARYADELRAAAPPDDEVPPFDVLLLGIGGEGHTASIFPESPAAHDERIVFGVHGCPKPPPTRVSLGFAAIGAAREVWLLAAGEGKAGAVAMALSGAGRVQIPAAGVRGTAATLWLLDEAAAAELPRELRRR
jgi:6-phosphogluconolactonase